MATSAITHNEPRETGASAITMNQLTAEMDRQRGSLREEVSTLIKMSVQPVQSSINSFCEQINAFQSHLDHIEALAGENFERLIAGYATIK